MTHILPQFVRAGVPSARILVPAVVFLVAIIPWLTGATRAEAGTWSFTNVTTAAGFNYTQGHIGGPTTEAIIYSAGVACGDYDNDGWEDLYVARGSIGANLLFRNLGNGTFQDVAVAAGVAQPGTQTHAPCFADLNGDGLLDLFIGGIESFTLAVYKNLGNGTFQNVTASTGIVYSGDTYGAALGDYDRDGDPDLWLAHFGSPNGTGNLWKNNGNFTFTDADLEAEIVVGGIVQYGFTPNWADINNDDWPDMLLVSDFGTSQIFLNDGDGTFTDVTSAVITDEDGMGGAVADYDNDGDLDWFVSSVWGTCCNKNEDPSRLLGISGNRLYRNAGNGTFQDVTAASGVTMGGWGWGASFQDFNNDGFVDIYHTNGYVGATQWSADSSRLFVADGDNTFTEMSTALGLSDTRRGRGIACFDYDRDGDLDIFNANMNQAPTFWRNDGGNANNWLNVKLVGDAPNTEAAGARVYVSPTGGALTYMREIRVGNNYISQDPTVAHFGAQALGSVSWVRVEWPDGQVDIFNNVPTNQTFVAYQTPTAIDLPPGEAAQGVTLLEVAPNPVVAGTSFRYSIERDAPVRLAIFDASGRAVRVLVDRVQAAGQHEARWDSRDDDERGVAAGVYLYKLEARGTTMLGKVSVVR